MERFELNGIFFVSCVSGPAFWGLINPEWSLCNKGRRQSPVNLEPQRLLFDPNLRPVHIDKHRVSVGLEDCGIFQVVICTFVSILDKRLHIKHRPQCHLHRRQ
jgi:Eukaryotic-type carbonic anhydrase